MAHSLYCKVTIICDKIVLKKLSYFHKLRFSILPLSTSIPWPDFGKQKIVLMKFHRELT